MMMLNGNGKKINQEYGNKKEALTREVRHKAFEIGFNAIGFARVRRLREEEKRLEQWLSKGRQGTMSWMVNHMEKRGDPGKLVPGAKSVLSLMIAYNQPGLDEMQSATDEPRISKYALGEDYHTVLKDKLKELYTFIRSRAGVVSGRLFVDTAPVMEKVWAVESGIGWMGKNTLVLSREWGSRFLLGEIILDIEFVYDSPVTDYCGNCTLCIDACPTNAIYEPYKLDASRCISYLTIELKDATRNRFQKEMGEWIFGCDICQDVCPWNKNAGKGTEPRLFAHPERVNRKKEFWEELSLEEYRRLFRKSVVKRVKYKNLKQNIHNAVENLKHTKKK